MGLTGILWTTIWDGEAQTWAFDRRRARAADRRPRDRDQLARLYTFEANDIDIFGSRREKQNLLGVALQLALLRHPGTSLAQMRLDQGELPGELVAFIAVQLGLSHAVMADYAARDQTMTDHARELAVKLGLRGPMRDDIPLMIDAAARAAWLTDKDIIIASGVIGWETLTLPIAPITLDLAA